MARLARHTDETAAEAMAQVAFDNAKQKRRKRRKRIRKQHERFCRKLNRLQRIVAELRQPGFCMRSIAQAHQTPHHTIVYIYTHYIMGEEE